MSDFRSDTVTIPCNEMRECMLEAKVGDNVFGEDESTLELESYAANLFGKESALFCVSGTMSNQLAIKVLTEPGDEIICDDQAHIHRFEGGGLAFNSGVSVSAINTETGIFGEKDIEKKINPNLNQFSTTSVVSIENTTNITGGNVWPINKIIEVCNFAKDNGLNTHLDGARLFNAMTNYSGITIKDIAINFDTISICLSKGLGAPMGSILISDKKKINRARKFCTKLGGSTRQSGFMAAAGLYALKNNPSRLKEDHSRAKRIGKSLMNNSYIETVNEIETNIVIAILKDNISAYKFIDEINKFGVKALAFGNNKIRFVSHLNISDEDIHQLEYALQNMENI